MLNNENKGGWYSYHGTSSFQGTRYHENKAKTTHGPTTRGHEVSPTSYAVPLHYHYVKKYLVGNISLLLS